MFSVLILVLSLFLAFASPQEAIDTKYYYLNDVNEVAKIEYPQEDDLYKWVITCSKQQRCWLDCYLLELSEMDRLIAYPVGENYETRWSPNNEPFNLMSTENQLTIAIASLNPSTASSFKCEVRIMSGFNPPDLSDE